MGVTARQRQRQRQRAEEAHKRYKCIFRVQCVCVCTASAVRAAVTSFTATPDWSYLYSLTHTHTHLSVAPTSTDPLTFPSHVTSPSTSFHHASTAQQVELFTDKPLIKNEPKCWGGFWGKFCLYCDDSSPAQNARNRTEHSLHSSVRFNATITADDRYISQWELLLQLNAIDSYILQLYEQHSIEVWSDLNW